MKLITQLARATLLVFLLTFFPLTLVHAQNNLPSDQGTEQAASDEQDLTDDQVDMILQKEGVPITVVNPNASAFSENSNYTLGADDIIEVSVARHPEVSGQYTLNSEGKIQYEFVGDVELSPLTKKQAADKLKEALSKYIISPEVNVKITGYNSKIVYVVGEVGRPGKIFMKGDTITVREALMQANLPLLSAKTGKSLVITPSTDGKPVHRKVNVYKLLYEGDLREDLVMKPGDTLYIPPTFLAKTMRAISPITQPVGEAASTGRTVTTGF